MTTPHHSLSPQFRRITVATKLSDEKQQEQAQNKAGGGGALLPALPRSSASQTFKISQDFDKIHVTDEHDSLHAVFEKGNDGHVLMVVRNAAGQQIAILKLKEKKDPRKEDRNHAPSPKTETLRLYGHEPLYPGQVPKRKRTYNGPRPLYSWGQLEKKTAGIFRGSTKFQLHIPLVSTEVVYTITARDRQQSLSLLQSLSQLKLLSLPFPTRMMSDHNDADNHKKTNINNNNNKSPPGEERKVTCQGRECAVLRRLEGSEQAVTVLADTDPMLMALFFAASNQLFGDRC
jgi:hypothetical protein